MEDSASCETSTTVASRSETDMSEDRKLNSRRATGRSSQKDHTATSTCMTTTGRTQSYSTRDIAETIPAEKKEKPDQTQTRHLTKHHYPHGSKNDALASNPALPYSLFATHKQRDSGLISSLCMDMGTGLRFNQNWNSSASLCRKSASKRFE